MQSIPVLGRSYETHGWVNLHSEHRLSYVIVLNLANAQEVLF